MILSNEQILWQINIFCWVKENFRQIYRSFRKTVLFSLEKSIN